MGSKTTRVKIKDTPHIKEAIQKAKAGMPTGELDIYADDSVSGLQLRVQGQRAFWALKYGSSTKNVGEVHSPKPMTREVPSITEARELAGSCKKVLDSVPDLFDAILNRYFEEPVGQRDFEVARTGVRRKATTWTLKRCFEFVIEDRTKEQAVEPIGKLYAEELRLSLRRPQMEDVLKKAAVELTRGDFDAVREGIRLNSGISPANKTLSHVRMVLDYCMRKASKDSGLDHKDEWWKLIESAGEVKKRGRVPTIDDIVKIMIVLEDFLNKPLPGRKARDGKAGVRANVFAAAWWLVLTGQRTFAALHLRRHDFFPDKEAAPGWYLAAWPEGVMKASVDFVLPIPPRVVQHMLPLIEASKSEVNDGSAWAFPSGRKAKKNTANKDITVNQSAVRQALQRLRGRDPLMKDDKGKVKADAVDFFEKLRVPWWTPHTIRAGLGKKLDQAGIPGGSSAILAHKIKMPERPANDRQNQEWLEQHVEDITAQAYHNPAHMTLKSKAMLVWTDAILDRYQELSPKHQVIRALQQRARVEPFIYKDIGSVDAAVALAQDQISDAIVVARKEAEMEASVFAEYSSRPDVRVHHMIEQKERMEAAAETLRKLVEEPHLFIADKSLELRGRTLAGIMHPDYAVFDFASEAPDYLEERLKYVAGQISRSEFEAHMVWKYGFDFSRGSDSIYLPGKDPRQALQQAA